MTKAYDPLHALERVVRETSARIPGLLAADLAMEMALPLGSALPSHVDAPTMLRQALVRSGKTRDDVAAMALAAEMRIATEADEQRWTDAGDMPPLTDEWKDENLAEMEEDLHLMTDDRRKAGEALFALRMDPRHADEGAAEIAAADPAAHLDILAHLLSLAADDASLMMIGANWLCGATNDQGGDDDDDDGPEPEPGPRPPGLTRRVRTKQDA